MKAVPPTSVKDNVRPTHRLSHIDRFDGHQRAFVKVQDGCDAFCAYCIVPHLRREVWSRSIDEVEAECRRLIAAGHREIVLSGVFLGAFGRVTTVRRRWQGPGRLPDLVRRVACLEGLWRVRLSSLEPGDLSDELIGLLAGLPAVAPHLHLPLQSGSDSVLKRMNRQYAADQYRRAIDRLRRALDRPAVSTDIIVGFPGESDADFQATLKLAEEAAFCKIHAFPFSAIEGTAAWRWRTEAPPAHVVRERMTALAEVERRTAAAYRRQFVGEVMEGLVERAGPAATQRKAMTDRYLTVRFKAPRANGKLTGQIVRLRIDGLDKAGLAGTLVE